jgi:hypothetical protein
LLGGAGEEEKGGDGVVQIVNMRGWADANHHSEGMEVMRTVRVRGSVGAQITLLVGMGGCNHYSGCLRIARRWGGADSSKQTNKKVMGWDGANDIVEGIGCCQCNK